MLYYEFNGEKISQLGFGAMRLPVIDGEDSKIDEAQATKMIDYAMSHGVNYYDTAWGYHGGNSEGVVGRALALYPRDSFLLADKFPGYDVSNFGKHEQIFEEQLRRCGVDYFDFYLLHNVNEANIEQYLDDEKYGTLSYFIRQKEEGRIRHLGFSVHGTFETFKRYMDVYGEHMEFCQIQLNYMDWDFQKAREKVEYLREHGIGIWVMEPLRGGNLISLDEEEMAPLRALRPEADAVDWAFRYVQDMPGVACVLSGMSNMEQLQANIELFGTSKPLSEEEESALLELGRKKAASKGVPCTACSYCVSHCPQELDIPRLLELYNEHVSRPDSEFMAAMGLSAMPKEKQPDACIACGACEDVCPQQIAIPDTLSHFASLMAK